MKFVWPYRTRDFWFDLAGLIAIFALFFAAWVITS